MQLINKIENFITDYVSFEDPHVAFPVALWIIATHLHQHFDTFPYMVITSLTKRSGKTRLSELISFGSNYPVNSAALTTSALFRTIDPIEPIKGFIPPTVIFDEAEVLSGEGATTMRAVLNVGYRKGQTTARTVGQNVVSFKVYCPKIFVLIGDVFDTLRDRSIVITMRRGEPRKRFLYDAAQTEGAELRSAILTQVVHNEPVLQSILSNYSDPNFRADFLGDRDEEIWSCLFAICKALCPERMRELQRVAVDLSALKSAGKRVATKMMDFEKAAEQEEYAMRALKDLTAVMKGEKAIFSDVAVAKMKELDLSPWRTFRGEGLEPYALADLMAVFGIRPTTVRIGKLVRKGYKASAMHKALGGL